MGTRVRSYAKVNLGLAIGPAREDGFHGLVTLYQTLDLHDFVTVSARVSEEIKISLTSDHPRVPCDGRNTAWKMVEGALTRLEVTAEVAIHIEKRLPVQGGMGAGSANAAAALIALERELGVALPEAERLALAAEVGSDVPLFLVGGAVLGEGRGEVVSPMADFAATACVVAIPAVGVSTPRAFREWDQRYAARHNASSNGIRYPGLTSGGGGDTLNELSRVYASVFREAERLEAESGTSGIVREPAPDLIQGGISNGLAENTLLELVRTGIENDFEEVVFSQYSSLREIKRQLMGMETGSPAVYAALSGSGSALFGLYRSTAEAQAAQQRVQASGVKALATETLPRAEYWRRMIAG
ncbi:4-(cytidine 5'-diphospho)-2-C-methyl-D-erythritol kinase [Granulicella sibirica]|uniref:4-diphosphocytidyl-2-C-methyl-D-erythritol kinase n=1 Tax=Granulicella sibirica TaxID=2479048 RepID=A0A4V1L636_9BACT|nr:4-(cytidine 5'-diphospho)-2-C-methyl-D-erythritol kinase [Granulicella sibirica]RXH57894.1 4-diphosphocytidyl-2-C-methyl-D-erythritol kinase [Granulicella sibirica]